MDFAECLRKCGFVSGKETAAECYFSNEAGDEVWGRKDTQGKFIEIQLKIKNKFSSTPIIDFALCLVEKSKWESLFCKGSDDFLNKIAKKIIPGQSRLLPSLNKDKGPGKGQLTFLLNRTREEGGFSEAGDWSPVPSRWMSRERNWDRGER